MRLHDPADSRDHEFARAALCFLNRKLEELFEKESCGFLGSGYLFGDVRYDLALAQWLSGHLRLWLPYCCRKRRALKITHCVYTIINLNGQIICGNRGTDRTISGVHVISIIWIPMIGDFQSKGTSRLSPGTVQRSLYTTRKRVPPIVPAPKPVG